MFLFSFLVHSALLGWGQLKCEHRRAIQLFHVPFAFHVVLFSLKTICSKRMRRLVSIGVFYILDGGLIAYGITHKY